MSTSEPQWLVQLREQASHQLAVEERAATGKASTGTRESVMKTPPAWAPDAFLWAACACAVLALLIWLRFGARGQR